MNDVEFGRHGEQAAAEFLESIGYRVLDRNYRFARNEIDLVCFDPTPNGAATHGEIVFVEVKTRRTSPYGRPEEAVNADKQQRVVEASRAYLYEKKLEGSPCRFDVVGVTIGKQGSQIEHFKDAFWT